MIKRFKFKDIILHEEDGFMIINKPAGLSSLDERIGIAPSVIALAKLYNENAQLCHRLDKETSGVMIIAKTSEYFKAINELFRKRDIDKRYHCISCGRHSFTDLTIDLPLSVSARGKAKIDHNEGKRAETTVNSIEIFGHYTLNECKPVTGKLHQIRIHLASQNAALAGDTTYGGNIPFLSHLKPKFKLGRGKEERPLMRGAALHAYSIKFQHPGSKEDVEFLAPYPKEMAVFYKLLQRYDSEKEFRI
jgi:23S rRNA pseudouridine955/2504/2580 synthase